MFKIEGLDQMQRELEEAQKAMEEIGGELGTVSFDPESPESIEAAITSMEQLIDERLAAYAGNSLIGPMIEGMKEQYRSAIIDKAAEARLEGEASDGE